MLLLAVAKVAPSARRILVVDDEPDIRQAIQELLQSSFDGARILAAASGPDGLRLLQDEPVDLIVTDYNMPGMTGVKFLEEADRLVPGIPRIIVTAFDQEVIRALAGGRKVQVLQKPFEPDTLVDLVATSLAAGVGA